jgi:predicted transposase YbfD/YdcC
MDRRTRSEHYAGGFFDSIAAFSNLSDPRTGRNKQHFFGEVLFIALAAIICQCEGFEDMERFAKNKKSWLRKFLKLPNGMSSNDTFRRVFSAIDPKAFNACFIAITESFSSELSSQLIAIDGKAIRHSFDHATEQSHLHLLSAYACEQGLSLDRLKVDTKSNEITAVPELLDMLPIEANTFPLDAMGCQKKIARKIHLNGGHYLMEVKGNHPHLHARLEQLFSSGQHLQYAEQQGSTYTSETTENKGHGREEKRVVLATDALGWIDKIERESWLGLGSFICVESHRKELRTGQSSVGQRYYLSSHKPRARQLEKFIRQHWSIENSCHWILDVVWDEDGSRIRKANAAENVALLRKIALNLLKANTSVKDTIRGKRL